VRAKTARSQFIGGYLWAQTVVSATATAVPPVLGPLVGAPPWRTAFALVALAPLLGSALLFGGRVAVMAHG
jgi:hypothetical protein